MANRDFCVGAIPITEIVAVHYLQNKSSGCRLQVVITNRVFDLQAHTPNEAKHWADCIQKLLDSNEEDSHLLDSTSLFKTAGSQSGKFWKKPASVLQDLGDDDVQLTTGAQSSAFTKIDASALKSSTFGTHGRSADAPSKSLNSFASASANTHGGGTLNYNQSPTEFEAEEDEIDYDEDEDLVPELGSPLTQQPSSPTSKKGKGREERCWSTSSWASLGSLETIETPTSISYADFDLLNVIQESDAGSVFCAKHRDSGRLYLMHVVRKTDANYETGMRAIENMESIQHAYMARRICQGLTPDRVWALYLRGPGGLLLDLIRVSRRLPEESARLVVAEVLLCIEYIQAQGLCFRNMDPEHIHLDSLGHIVITDMSVGSCTFDNTIHNHYPEFCTPEYIDGKPETASSDLWRLGILIYYLMVGFPPFRGATASAISAKIAKRKIRYPPFCSAEAQDCINRLLQIDAEQRLGRSSLTELKAHPFFTGIDWSGLGARAVHSTEFIVKVT